ncbi:MAG: hypothetical protein ACFFC7_10840 [Candidatus Hermodarchaeota archaeon]
MKTKRFILTFMAKLFAALAIIFMGLAGYGFYVFLQYGPDAKQYFALDPSICSLLAIFFGLLALTIEKLAPPPSPDFDTDLEAKPVDQGTEN